MVKSAVCRVLNWHIVDFQGVYFVREISRYVINVIVLHAKKRRVSFCGIYR